MFAAPSHPPAVTDARKTFANTSGRPGKPHLELKHNLTGTLPHTIGFKTAASSTTDKKQQLALMLEENLVRQFGGSPAVNELIKHQIQAALLSGTRFTPDTMRQLQQKIAQIILKEPSASKSAVPKATAVLSSTATRATTITPSASTSSLSKSGKRVMYHESKPSFDNIEEEKPAARGTAPSRSLSELASLMRETAKPALSQDSLEEGGADAGEAASPQLKELRARLHADPEPEKVLGLIDEVKAKLAAKKDRDTKVAKFEELRTTLRAAEDEKKIRKDQEKVLESMWKLVVDESSHDMARREAEEAEAARQREAEQRAIREKQIAEVKARRAHELAERRAYESYHMKLTLAQDELQRQEAAREMEEKKALVKRQMEDNLKIRDVKKQSAEVRRLDEKRAMEEYNAMMEAQARAQKEAIKAVYARQDTLLAIADAKRKEQLAHEAAEKERTLSEFEDARRRIAEAERAEFMAKKASAGTFRDELNGQVEEKKHRNDKEKESARRTQLMLQERARIAERELREAKLAQVEAHAEYRKLLEQQMLAAKRLRELKRDRERQAIAASLEELEEDPELMNEVSKQLAQRAAAAEKARQQAELQAQAMREALIAAGLPPTEHINL